MPDNLDFGTMTDTFTTNEEGKIYLTKPLKHGTYTLKEIEAPEKYLVADPLVFTVDGAYSYEEPLVVECFDEDADRQDHDQKKRCKDTASAWGGISF